MLGSELFLKYVFLYNYAVLSIDRSCGIWRIKLSSGCSVLDFFSESLHNVGKFFYHKFLFVFYNVSCFILRKSLKWICWLLRKYTNERASQETLVVKNPPAKAGDSRDVGSIPGSRRSLGGGHGNPLQYPCLDNPMDRGAWRAKAYQVTELDTTEST